MNDPRRKKAWGEARRRLHLLACGLGLTVAPKPCKPGEVWLEQTPAGPCLHVSEDPALFMHELAHWLVATDSERTEVNYGLERGLTARDAERAHLREAEALLVQARSLGIGAAKDLDRLEVLELWFIEVGELDLFVSHYPYGITERRRRWRAASRRIRARREEWALPLLGRAMLPLSHHPYTRIILSHEKLRYSIR